MRPLTLSSRSRPRPAAAAAGETMNGGVIVESNTPLPAPAALKQELLTEHYAISAKRASQKDKMNRQLKVNTGVEGQPPYPPSFGSGPPPPNYPPSYSYGPPPAPGYYPPPPHSGHLPYPPGHAGPAPAAVGPARRQSQPFAMPPQAYPGGMPHYPPQWENASPVASSTSSHKRKRSESSVTGGEHRTPRGGAIPLVPEVDPSPHSARSAQQLPTPPSSVLLLPGAHDESRPHGVYVTATDEGRKLMFKRNSTGAEAKETTPTRGPPRMKSTTTLSVSATGKAALGSSEVLKSDLDLLEKTPQGTPNGAGNNPRTPTPGPKSHAKANDTPGTKANKMTRRLSAFNLATRQSEPMYSIRLDMGQGQPCRVALRKDLALAFVGLDKATSVVEESRTEDEDGWAATVNGAPGSRPPARPNWPDEEGPWKSKMGAGGARQLRREKERAALLRRYLETLSDDDEDDDGAGRFPSHKGKAAGAPRRMPGRSPAGTNTTSDAKVALVSALNRTRRAPPRFSAPPMFMPNGVVNCVCRSTAGGSLVACASCKTWHHLACIGLEDPQMVNSWVCDPCVAQARRATLSSPAGRTPSATRYTHERSHSGFRGGDVALALAPSPMFAGDPSMGVQSTPVGMGSARTPLSPGRRSHRARVLSYGTDLWGSGGPEDSPTTPVPPPRIPDHFSTPRPEDSVFDVNSTPSRHLNTDPRISGQFSSLFAVTPLVGRSHNVPGTIAHDTPVPGGARGRNVSGSGPHALSDNTGVVNRHEFLQDLTADRDRDRRGPATDLPASPPHRRGVLHEPDSPSPYGNIGLGHRKYASVSLRGPSGGSGGASGLRAAVGPSALGTPLQGERARRRERSVE